MRCYGNKFLSIQRLGLTEEQQGTYFCAVFEMIDEVELNDNVPFLSEA